MNIFTEPVRFPEGLNVIFGQSHFIKTVEDLYEALVTSVPGLKFGIAFNEASGPCLIRRDGTDSELIDIAVENQQRIAAGHTFLIVLRDAFPVNVIESVRAVREVVTLFCATGNPVDVILAQSETGRGVLGVIDGESPKGIETDEDADKRRQFLRMIGYKR
jgi:adenosine/AMP kinase